MIVRVGKCARVPIAALLGCSYYPRRAGENSTPLSVLVSQGERFPRHYFHDFLLCCSFKMRAGSAGTFLITGGGAVHPRLCVRRHTYGAHIIKKEPSRRAHAPLSAAHASGWRSPPKTNQTHLDLPPHRRRRRENRGFLRTTQEATTQIKSRPADDRHCVAVGLKRTTTQGT